MAQFTKKTFISNKMFQIAKLDFEKKGCKQNYFVSEKYVSLLEVWTIILNCTGQPRYKDFFSFFMIYYLSY